MKPNLPTTAPAAPPVTLPVEIVPKRVLPGGQIEPPKSRPPRFALVTYRQDERGNLIPESMEWAEWIKISRAELERLGIGIDRNTLRRLGYNGYVQLRRVSPQVTEVHLGSLRRHIRRVQEDLQFWHRRSIPAGWTEDGDIIWEESLVSRMAVFQTNDLPATCLGADRHVPMGVIKVASKRSVPGREAYARQTDLFGEESEPDSDSCALPRFAGRSPGSRE